jgi:hypothetical protein
MTDDFDFWLGTWRGTWQDGERSAVNTITKEYGGNVVVERFVAHEPETLNGLSVSVFDAKDACWKQTWVDDNASYLDFRGGFDGQAMVLSRQLLDGPVIVTQRMVWHDIEDERFLWAWQRSRAGADWETLWAIAYERIS